MRARTEAALAVGLLAALSVVAGLLAPPGAGPAATDERPSTFLAGPDGSRGLLEATRALGIEVRRFRERPGRLAERLEDGPRQTLAILGPSFPFSPLEAGVVLGFGARADLLLAGSGTDALMRCFGYQVKRRRFDSLQVAAPGTVPGAAEPWVHAELQATREREQVDSSRAADTGRSSCTVPAFRSVERLLVGTGGELVAVRLWRADLDRRVILVADEALFRNRTLRRTSAGPFALGLFAGRTDRVVFEEYHHGFGASGSLAGATLAWSRRSPLGWAVWQWTAVAVLALLFGAVRFGPVRPGIVRRRRSPLEHVRALATALSAARGQDEAIGAMVRGLRRRLAPPGLRARGDWREWLQQLGRHRMAPPVQASLDSLRALTTPGQPPSSVLKAANAVEDLWLDLRP